MKSMIINNLIIDLAVSHAEKEQLLAGMKTSAKYLVSLQTDDQIREFASFKMNIILTNHKFNGYQNTEVDLFTKFMTSKEYPNFHLEWDEKTKKIILVQSFY